MTVSESGLKEKQQRMQQEETLTPEQETWLKTAAVLRTAYQGKDFLVSDKAVDLWYQMLQDIPMDKVQDAVARYIMEEHFPPTIADIRNRCFAQQAAALPDWEQGWGELMNAIHRYGYMREAEALASLNPITAETVKALGYQALCASENPEGDRISFREIHSRYTALARQNLQLADGFKVQGYRALENSERPMIEAVQENMRYRGTDQRTEGYAETAASRIREGLENGI